MVDQLTEDDLEVAEASVKFAMDNCPVEGVLSNEDGTSISLDEMQTILDSLQEVERTPGTELRRDVATALKSVIDYTSESCPVEGVAIFHDGRSISGRNVMTLREKLAQRASEKP